MAPKYPVMVYSVLNRVLTVLSKSLYGKGKGAKTYPGKGHFRG